MAGKAACLKAKGLVKDKQALNPYVQMPVASSSSSSRLTPCSGRLYLSRTNPAHS